ncbi:amine oxidoreductase [Lachnospiraceae bacterium]|jgi:protoporphyrinogen oxidase|nr:amine oxidoreductase [Lachnospiraceae bacterium]
MQKVKYLILGAGPAGLSFACKLSQEGERNFLVLEKEDTAGGLCRSEIVDHAPIDIGGGHFLDTKDNEVLDFLFHFMPQEEWNLFKRDSHIEIGNLQIDHPMEANIWQMNIDNQIEYLKSIAVAGCNAGIKKPELFSQWIIWKLGRRIADDYMLPYNQKLFGSNFEELGTYWLEKLPNVSFEETLRSCIEKKPYGKEPAHTFFYYPKKYGYGEVWRRMADSIKNKIIYGYKVKMLDVVNRVINNEYAAEYIINTCPWSDFELDNIPYNLKADTNLLKYVSICVEYDNKELASPAQWVYIPSQEVMEHRILIRKNFITGAKGYWKEINFERYKNESNKVSYCNTYSYPVNSMDKPRIMNSLLSSMKLKNIFGLGRWGEWEHLNSDAVVRHALNLVQIIKSG